MGSGISLFGDIGGRSRSWLKFEYSAGDLDRLFYLLINRLKILFLSFFIKHKLHIFQMSDNLYQHIVYTLHKFKFNEKMKFKTNNNNEKVLGNSKILS